MKKEKNRRIKRILSLVCVVLLVLGLAAMPLLARQEEAQDGHRASILSGVAEVGEVNSRVIGGGSLTEEEAVSLELPEEVKLTGFLVENGEEVSQGDPVAAVDRVSVMTAIASVQETLDLIDEDLEAEGEEKTDGDVAALAGGKVKILYAAEGDTVQDVMLEHGALAVLSLDSLMAVEFETETALSVGEEVTLTLSDGSEVKGTVETSLAGKITVTIEDEDYPVGDEVTVKSSAGDTLGGGSLVIFSPWKATAYAGVVEEIDVKEGETVKAGESLMTLSDTGNTATYRKLLSSRQSYEALLMELFTLYQTETLTAPCDGVVSGVDAESIQLLSGGQRWSISLLANAPDGRDDLTYTNLVGRVEGQSEGGIALWMDPQPVEITDYKLANQLPFNGESMTEAVVLDPFPVEGAATPLYVLRDGAWSTADWASVGAGDRLLMALDGEQKVVWVILVQAGDDQTTTQPEEPPTTEAPENPEEPPTTEAPENPEEPPTTEAPENPEEPPATEAPGDTQEPPATETPGDTQEPPATETPDSPSTPDNPGANGGQDSGGTQENPGGSGGQTFPGISGGQSFPSGTGSITGGSWSGSGSVPQTEMMLPEEEEELYPMEKVQILSVTPQSAMTMVVTVSELDVTGLWVGMETEIKINALGGEKHSAVISDIANTGSNNGGYSTFDVTVTMERGENMLGGMNATVTAVTATASGVVTLPAEALVEDGTQTTVYTGYDPESESLTDPVTVTVGASDGLLVEVLDGIEAGTTYYYAYYDTLEIANTPDFGGDFGGLGGLGGMGGGFPMGR